METNGLIHVTAALKKLRAQVAIGRLVAWSLYWGKRWFLGVSRGVGWQEVNEKWGYGVLLPQRCKIHPQIDMTGIRTSRLGQAPLSRNSALL